MTFFTTVPEAVAAYECWLTCQPLSSTTRRTYLTQVHCYGDYLSTLHWEYGYPLQEPHARDYAVTNAVMTWNMVYMSDAIANLRAQGHAVTDSDLVHLSPALYAHINRYGTYHFEATSSPDQQTRRPLRQPSVLKA